MPTRTFSLALIRRVWRQAGPVLATQVARVAFAAGRLDRRDVPEVFLALKAGAEPFLEELSRHPPGARRFPAAR
jgi:hypothetical protein